MLSAPSGCLGCFTSGDQCDVSKEVMDFSFDENFLPGASPTVRSSVHLYMFSVMTIIKNARMHYFIKYQFGNY